jgi:gluconokinase
MDNLICRQSPIGIIILMGVAGAGKSTVGRRLSDELKWRFCDGDTLHPAVNIDKMKQGIALTDEDRRPWLDRLHEALVEWIGQGQHVVLACSLLKAAYRAHVLDGHRDHIQLVYLKANRTLLQQRLLHRTGHFLREGLLASQLEILEEPAEALMIDASLSPETIVRQIRSACGL